MWGRELIASECDAIKRLLIRKNRAYGDSAFRPVGVFARGASPDLLLRVRIDDKLARIMRGRENGADEDTVMDLIGYLVLLRAYRRLRR